MKKLCRRCWEWKPTESFQQREDSWGLYAWCDECREREGRATVPADQAEYIEKTRMFMSPAPEAGTKNTVQRRCRDHVSPAEGR